jgi:histidyl-tRNA synthetase
MGSLTANANARAGMEEMGLLIDYVTALGILEDRISFDMSLARGWDCSTGVIYAAVTEGSAPGRCKRWRR